MSTSSDFSDELVESPADNDIDFKEILQRYVKHWRWFVLSVIVMLAIGIIYAKMQVPQYSINIAILIKDKEQSSDKDILQQLNLNSSEKIIDNEIQILKTSMLMEKVIQSLELENTYVVENNFSKSILYNKYVPFKLRLLAPATNVKPKKWMARYINAKEMEFDGKIIPFNHPVQTAAGLLLAIRQDVVNPTIHPINVLFGSVEGAAQYYISKLVITPASKQATVLFISMEDEVPERGKDILTRLVDVYNQMSIDDKNKTTANTLNFIESRLAVVAGELNNVEKSVENYKSSNRIVDMSAQSSIFLNSVQSNDDQITKINLEFGSLKNLEDYINNENSNLDKLPSMQGIEDPSLLALVSQLGTAQTEKERKLRTIPETNPAVGSINDEIKALKKTVLQTLQNVRSGLADSKRQLQQQNAKYESIIKGVPSKERGLIDVMRDRDIKNNLFTFLLQKREETQIELASTVSDSKTIDRAKSSGMYFKPAKNIIYITYFIIGLLLPIVIIYLRGVLNSTIRRRNNIERGTRVPILAQLSFSEEPDTMVTINHPRSMIAEQIRAMRTNLEFVIPDVKSKNILFTSSISGEGKSFISLNLGASLASTGKKAVVLELDLRKPRFYISLGLDNDLGLSGYLIGKNDYSQIIKQHPKQPNLSIITSGVIPPNPAELLLNGKIEVLLEELKKEYDYIIMDAPPVGLLTDAQILSKYADVTLFVIRYNYTQKESINLIEEFRVKRVFKKLNIIFNSVDYRRSGYGYGYGYGYYEESTTKKSWWQKKK